MSTICQPMITVQISAMPVSNGNCVIKFLFHPITAGSSPISCLVNQWMLEVTTIAAAALPVPAMADAKVALPSVPTYVGRKITENHLSGAYYLNRIGSKRSSPEFVFKPQSEEATSSDSPLKEGIIIGESVIKEAVAYLVDHEGFAGVPETDALRIHVRLPDRSLTEFGSLQKFVDHEASCEEFGTSLLDMDNIHRIGLLDLRLANLDRHEGNLLVQRSPDHDTMKLIPIDHSYVLPSWRCLRDVYFCWSSWRQASLPFTKKTKAYVASLKPLLDVPDLIELGIQHDSAVTYIICSLFVQRAVAADWTLNQIATVMQRNASDVSSVFEQMVERSAKSSGFCDFHFSDTSSWDNPVVRVFLFAFIDEAKALLKVT